MEFDNIIGIGGKICSGKSFVAAIISKQYGFPVASFGSYLRFYCHEKKLSDDRENLQDLGEKFVKEKPRQFLLDVIHHFIGDSSSIIIEGIRHKIILDLIKDVTKKSILIFVEADARTRYERYKQRETEEINFEEFIVLDNHPVEKEIEDMKPLYDYTIPATKNYNEELLTFLQSEIGK